MNFKLDGHHQLATLHACSIKLSACSAVVVQRYNCTPNIACPWIVTVDPKLGAPTLIPCQQSCCTTLDFMLTIILHHACSQEGAVPCRVYVCQHDGNHGRVWLHGECWLKQRTDVAVLSCSPDHISQLLEGSLRCQDVDVSRDRRFSLYIYVT